MHTAKPCGLFLGYSARDVVAAEQQILHILGTFHIPFSAAVDPEAGRLQLSSASGSQEINFHVDKKSTIEAAAHMNCSTPALPLGADVSMAVREGRSFRCVHLAVAPHPKSLSLALPDRQFRVIEPETLPMGLVIMGTRTCGYTLSAVQLVSRLGLPFYYLDITGSMGDIHEKLELLLCTDFLFEEGDRKQALHNTVPIVLLDRQLVGGFTQISAAMRADDLSEQVKDSAKAAVRDCVFIPATADISEATKLAVHTAVSTGKVLRVVNVLAPE
jgi:glutaredoxin-related protein